MKRTGVSNELNQSIISKVPSLPGVLIAFPDHDFTGFVD